MDGNGDVLVLTLEILILCVTSVLAVGSLIALTKLCKLIDAQGAHVSETMQTVIKEVASQPTGVSFPSAQAIIDAEAERAAYRPFEQLNPFEGLDQIRLSEREKRDVWGVR